MLAALGIVLSACGDTATPIATSAAASTTSGTTAAMTTSGATMASGTAMMTSSGTAMASGTSAMASGTAMMTGGAMASGTAMMTTSGTAMASGTPAMAGGTAMMTGGTVMASGTLGMMTGTAMASGTPAMMTGGTAMASGTAMMTGGAAGSFPTISGATEVPADSSVAPALAQQLGTVGVKPNAVKFYVSDNEAAALATTADTAITGSGYKFGLPGFNKPLTLPGASNTIGLYSVAGQPDLLMLIAAVPTDPTKVNSTFLLPGLDAATDQKIVDALKGHKSAMILLSGTNLQQAILALVTGAAKSMPGGMIMPAITGAMMTGGAMMTPAPSPTK